MTTFRIWLPTMPNKLKQFAAWMNGLKNNKTAIIILIAIDGFMAVTSNVVDWDWLMSVEWYAKPFAPICSLYPLTLTIWYLIYLFKGKVPNWYTTFIFIGIISYGVMAWIYFPLFMQWSGFDLRMTGNMLWVTAYALQSFIIASELKPIKWMHLLPIVAYFLVKDYSDRFLGSFIDIYNSKFPSHLENFFALTITTLHLAAIATYFYLSRKNTVKPETQLQEQPEYVKIKN